MCWSMKWIFSLCFDSVLGISLRQAQKGKHITWISFCFILLFNFNSKLNWNGGKCCNRRAFLLGCPQPLWHSCELWLDFSRGGETAVWQADPIRTKTQNMTALYFLPEYSINQVLLFGSASFPIRLQGSGFHHPGGTPFTVHGVPVALDPDSQ